jgi:hypothetical protein
MVDTNSKGFLFAREFEDFVNGYSSDNDKDFVEGFKRMHNTLQQSSVRLMFKCIEAMAETQYVDARNSSSKDVAVKMIEGFRKEQIEMYIRQGTSPERAKECVGTFKPSEFLGYI